MEFVTVNVLSDSKEIKIIKEIVDALSEKLPYLIFTPFKYGKIGDDTLVTFKVEKRFHQFVIEKLTFNSIRIVTFDEKTKHYVETAKNQVKNSSSGSAAWSSVKPKQKEPEKKTLEDYINEGDYSEVIKISRDVTLTKEEIDKAKNSIDNCVLRSINSTYNDAQTRKFEIYKSIEKLIKIASDNSLKTLQKIEYIKQAGLHAVEICSQNRDYVADLINISNNNALHSIVNVKAAIKFGELILADRDTYKTEIYTAKRNLNTRWLSIAFCNVENDLSVLEKETFNNLIDFIKNNKSL